MIILVNSTHFIPVGGSNFFDDYLANFAASKREHQFIFIVPVSPAIPFTFPPNIIQVISSPKANNPLMWKLWLNYTLPAIARKYKADLLIHSGGVCSLRTRLPQWTFISDLSFLHLPQFFEKKQLRFLIKNMPAFLNKAGTIVTASWFITNEIEQYYSVDNQKIQTHPLVAGSLYQTIEWEEKEALKEKYADGKEYFFFNGDIHPRHKLVNLLKAFSFFKKRQKSNMQLIIAGKTLSENDPFIDSLKTYKYRKEVNVLMDLREKDLAKITAAAYAFVYPSLYAGMALQALQAMQCGVPVITSNTGALIETCGEAALYMDAENFEDIADKMMLMFKDENLRSGLINKGSLIVQQHNKSNDRLWEGILG